MVALFGRYEYRRELGRGATGRVLAVRDLAENGAERAIKVVSGALRPRLIWEFERLCRVDHVRVARVRELLQVEEPVHAPFGLSADSLLLVEDLAPGVPLSRLDLSLDERARLELALRVALSASEALSAIHDAGLVHGDVKPDNLLVDAAGASVTLVDLGFAAPPSLRDTPRGTPRFMAPELFSGVRSPAADVYALGALLFDWLVGDVLEESSGQASGLFMRKVSALSPVVPAPLASLLTLFLQPDPALRPADGKAAFTALLPVAEQLGASLADARMLLHEAPSAEARAARARTLPFVGQARELEALAAALQAPGVVLVRGAQGAGRSRLVREALRKLQLSCAEGQRPLPTVLRSFEGLQHVHGVPAVLWLEPDATELPRELAAAQRAAVMAEVPLTVVIEAEPQAQDAGIRGIDVGPLANAELGLLLGSLLAPLRPDASLIAAAARASQSLAGRLCELTAQLFAAGRDAADPRSYAAPAWTVRGQQLSEHALTLAGMFAWWGEALVPSQGDLLLPRVDGLRARDAAFAELWAKGLLGERAGQLELPPALASELRTRLFERRHELVAPLAERAPPRTGFALFALGRREQALAAFARDGDRLRASGEMDAAQALLEQAVALLPATSLRLSWADCVRARADYPAAERVLEDESSEAAGLLRAEVLRLQGKSEQARTALSDLCSGPLADRARALSARLSFDTGAYDDAREQVAQVLAGTEPEARVRALEVELLLELTQGLPPRDGADRLVSEAAALGSGRARARSHALRSQLYARHADQPAALVEALAALDHARRAGEAHEAATYALNLGLLQSEAGELGLSLVTLREAAYRLSRIDRPADLVRVMFNLAALALLVGDDTRAEAVLGMVERALHEVADPAAAALVAVARAELLTRKGQLEPGCRLLEQALRQVPEQLTPVRAVLAARAAQALLQLGRSSDAEVVLNLARTLGQGADLGVVLELGVAEIRWQLACNDAVAAEAAAQRGMVALRRGAPFAERLRFLIAAIDAARAVDNEQATRERTQLCRASLEVALAGLEPSLRARMRERPEYARVLAASANAPRQEQETGGRWRKLVLASRRLFAAPQRARIAEQLVAVALELVHAERALLIACTEQGALEVRARAELSPDAGRLPLYSRSVVERVWGERLPLITLDAAHDLRLHAAYSIHALSVRSVLAVPIDGFGEPMVLYLDDRLRAEAFAAQDLALLEDLAALAREALRVGQARRQDARRVRKAEQEASALNAALAATSDEEKASPLVGISRALTQVTTSARRVAKSDVSLLITGESGTGKELLARVVHDESPRRSQPFVAESCAALPDALLESALFGHVRGAFTGADKVRRGLFETADKGTLFLDEVGEMSPALQAKLLRVLQEGVFRPLGSEREKQVDVRVVAATRRDLPARVRTGQFREDLYYRLAVVTLELPPLANRREDIPLLVRHFVDKHQPKGRAVKVSSAALRAFTQRDYPGNIRQLENEVRRALAFCSDDRIELTDVQDGDKPRHDAHQPEGLHARLDQLTRQLIDDAMARSSGNVTQAAELLGISRFGLQKMLKRHKPSAQRK